MQQVAILFDRAYGVASVALSEGRPLLRHLTVYRYCRDLSAIRRQPEQYYRVQGQTLQFPAKLWGHLLERLLPEGIVLRPRTLYRLVRPTAQVAWTPLSRVFAQPHVWHGALFRKPAQVSTHDQVVELLRMYPTRRVAILAKNRGEAARWRQRLLRSGVPQPVGTSYSRPGGDLLRRPLALVVSYSFLDFCGPLSDMDLAIVPEVGPLRDCDQWDAGRKRPRSRDYEGLRVPSFPVFGFMPESEQLSDGEELRLRSIFTQILSPYLDEYQPGQARTIALASRLPAFADEPTSREVMRSAIYENEERNREVAKISAGESTDWARVLLLVESPLHARRLADLLPEWTVHDHGTQVVGERNLIITDACLTKQSEKLVIGKVIDARGRGTYNCWQKISHPSRVELITLKDPGAGVQGLLGSCARRPTCR